MSRYSLQPGAEADLEDIWRYSIEHWGEERAERYMNDLRQAMERAAGAPSAGQEVRLGAGVVYVRRAVSHRIFYRTTADGIEVLRVLHARMDFGRHLP